MTTKQKIKSLLHQSMIYSVALIIAISFYLIVINMATISNWVAHFIEIIRPFIVGFVIAFLVNPIYKFLVKYLSLATNLRLKTVKKISVFLSIIFFILLITVFIILIVPQFITSALSIIEILPDQYQKTNELFVNLIRNNKNLLEIYSTFSTQLNTYMTSFVTTKLAPYLQNILMGVVSTGILIKDFIIGIIIAVYILLSKELFKVQANLVINSIFDKKGVFFINNEVKYADRMFTGFISGKIIDSLIIGVITYFCCLIFKFPEPLLLAVIIGITNIIPFFGPFIGAIPTTLLVLIMTPGKTLWFMLFVLCLQQVDGNIIGPKVLGESTGLSSFWVLFAILLFGGLWGFIGMIVGVPLFAVIYEIARNMVRIGLINNGNVELLEEYYEFKGD